MKLLNSPFVIVVLFSTFCFYSMSSAQDPRQQQRRAFVQDLLKTLIESQVEPNQASGHDHVRPGQPTRPVRPPVQVSPKMIQAREQLRLLSDQAEHLVYDLRNEDADNPQIRSLVGDALQIKANIDILYQKSLRLDKIQPLLPEFQIVDRDWRILNHRLSKLNSLSPQCKKCISTFHQYENSLCTLLEVQPQFSRGEIARLTNLLSNDLQHLIQDIYYDFRNDPNMPATVKQGQALHAQINQAAMLIPRGNYESIVTAYQGCAQNWRKFSRQLRRYSSDRLNRDIQRIEAHGAQIHDLLWLKVEVDRDYIVHVTQSINKDVQKLYKEITLEEMLKCRQPGKLVGAAKDFQRLCAGFAESVSSGAPMDELAWDYRAFEVQWETLHEQLHELETARMKRRVGEIENQFVVLQENFGEGPIINRMDLVQIAANLDQLTGQLSRDVHRRIVQPKYSHGFHEQFCSLSDNLNLQVRSFHQQCLSRPGTLSTADLQVIFDQWNNTKSLINKCEEADRRELARYRRQIEPLMVKLQIVYAG